MFAMEPARQWKTGMAAQPHSVRIVVEALKTRWVQLKSSKLDAHGHRHEPPARTSYVRVRRFPDRSAATRPVFAQQRANGAGDWQGFRHFAVSGRARWRVAR